jgi:hypothetical protein
MTKINRTPAETASQQLLDYLMNDPTQQAALHQFIEEHSQTYGIDFHAVAADESKENTAEYSLYYTLTAEWHANVLAQAIRFLGDIK